MLFSFRYNVDEMLWELVYINLPVVKLVSLYVVLLKVAQPVNSVK